MHARQIKEKIKRSFNRAQYTYDQHSTVQRKASRKLSTIVKQQGGHYPVIADFACGTGISTQHLLDNTDHHKVFAIDFSEKLLDVAASKFKDPCIEFVHADFDQTIFDENSLDLIYCNMGLQWSLNLSQTLSLFNRYLKTGGTLAFSMPTEGTFSELNTNYKNPCRPIHDILQALTSSGFELRSTEKEIYVEQFHSQLEALRSIQAVGANCLISDKKQLQKFSIHNCFANANDSKLTYQLGLFMAVKKESSS